MAYTFNETAVSFCRSEAIMYKNTSVGGSSAEIVPSIGTCQIAPLKIQVFVQHHKVSDR